MTALGQLTCLYNYINIPTSLGHSWHSACLCSFHAKVRVGMGLARPPIPLIAPLPAHPLTFLGSSLIILDTFSTGPYQKIFRKKFYGWVFGG